MCIISVAINKGGSGKSTTVRELAAHLGSMDKRVLVIDLDAQASTTKSCCGDEDVEGVEEQILQLFEGKGVIKPVRLKYFDLINGCLRLSAIEMLTINGKEFNQALETFKYYLEKYKEFYDYILLDSGPGFANMQKIILEVSEYTIIPVEVSPLACVQVEGFINFCKDYNTKVLGVLLIKYIESQNLHRLVKDEVQKVCDDNGVYLFDTYIHQSCKVPESQAEWTYLVDYAKKSKPAIDYNNFIDEVLERLKEIG